MPHVVWAVESKKTDLGFESGPQQQKCQRKFTLQFLSNPAVHHNFCCRGTISNPRPLLDFSTKTTRGMLLVFVKPQKMLI